MQKIYWYLILVSCGFLMSCAVPVQHTDRPNQSQGESSSFHRTTEHSCHGKRPCQKYKHDDSIIQHELNLWQQPHADVDPQGLNTILPLDKKIHLTLAEESTLHPPLHERKYGEHKCKGHGKKHGEHKCKGHGKKHGEHKCKGHGKKHGEHKCKGHGKKHGEHKCKGHGKKHGEHKCKGHGKKHGEHKCKGHGKKHGEHKCKGGHGKKHGEHKCKGLRGHHENAKKRFARVLVQVPKGGLYRVSMKHRHWVNIIDKTSGKLIPPYKHFLIKSEVIKKVVEYSLAEGTPYMLEVSSRHASPLALMVSQHQPAPASPPPAPMNKPYITPPAQGDSTQEPKDGTDTKEEK